MARWRQTAAVLMLSCGLIACSGQDKGAEQAKAEEEKQKAIEAKREALNAYRVGGIKVSDRLEEFKTTLQDVQSACREECDIQAHKKDFEAKVLPAFEQVLASLDAMPTETKELEGIHRKLVKAYRKSGLMLIEYPKELKSTNKDARLVAYIQDLSVSISEVEKAYNKELEAYCSSDPKVDCALPAAE